MDVSRKDLSKAKDLFLASRLLKWLEERGKALRGQFSHKDIQTYTNNFKSTEPLDGRLKWGS